MNKHKTILLSHGSGGSLTQQLINDIICKHFTHPILKSLGDAAFFSMTGNNRIAFTTDSYVITPPFFPGGDIGKLAVCGTVNDLAVSGAIPMYLSCGLILEEGLEIDELEKIIISMAKTAEECGVSIITGDTKVVERGNADKIFINTSGIGFYQTNREFQASYLEEGDKIIINGNIAEHGMAILTKREGLNIELPIESDVASLNGLIQSVLETTSEIKCMRDPTRGGIATVLNEWAQQANVEITIDENQIPIEKPVMSACDILGIDPLYVANEGKVLFAVSPSLANTALTTLQKHKLGKNAKIIGEVTAKNKGRVILKTNLGTKRILNMLTGEQLPRIC